MARGRTTALTISLTPEERQTLLAWQRSTTIRAGLEAAGPRGRARTSRKPSLVKYSLSLPNRQVRTR